MEHFIQTGASVCACSVLVFVLLSSGRLSADEPVQKPAGETNASTPAKVELRPVVVPSTKVEGGAKGEVNQIEVKPIAPPEVEKSEEGTGKKTPDEGKKDGKEKGKIQKKGSSQKKGYSGTSKKVGGGGGPDLLSARSVLAETVRANLRIREQKLELNIAKEQLRGEWGIFEPDFLATVAREANYRQNTRQQFLSQSTSTFNERNRINSIGIETMLPTGGKLQLNAQNKHLRNNLQNAGETESESFAGFSVTQPLLKNAGWGTTVAQIRIAAAQSKLVFQEYRKQLMLVLSQAELAYWDLVAARDFEELREQSVRVAERVLLDNKARVEAGKMTEIEVLQAESGLMMRIAGTMDAAQKIVAATSQLNAFFGRAGRVNENMRPTESLAPATVGRDATAALLEAFKSHPLYLAQIEKSRQDDIRLAFTKNQRLPQLDLKASYGYNGLGTSFTTSADVVGSTQFPSWYLGFEMRIPLGGGIKTRSQMAVAQLRKEQGLLELKAVEVELTTAVSTLVHKVNAAQEKARGYRKVVQVNERLLDTELTRLAEGKSDSRKVLQAEQDLADARVSELDARLEWQRANIELLVQTGTYLAKRDHEISADR